MTYPIELKVAGRHVLVVGGGEVAARRAESLAAVGAVVRVVSLEFVPELQQLQNVERIVAAYSPEMIGWAWLVFACVDDVQVNARVAEDARAAGVLCNAADDPDECDFFMPSVLRRGALTLAVGTGGASPALAARLREGLESQFDFVWGILMEELQRARDVVREQVHAIEDRRRIMKSLASAESVEQFRQNPQAWKSWLEQLVVNAQL